MFMGMLLGWQNSLDLCLLPSLVKGFLWRGGADVGPEERQVMVEHNDGEGAPSGHQWC
jgi:uncharacterized protein YheU (UPF0270 family)